MLIIIKFRTFWHQFSQQLLSLLWPLPISENTQRHLQWTANKWWCFIFVECGCSSLYFWYRGGVWVERRSEEWKLPGKWWNKNQNNCLIFITWQTDKAERNDDNVRGLLWGQKTLKKKYVASTSQPQKHKLLPGVLEKLFSFSFFSAALANHMIKSSSMFDFCSLLITWITKWKICYSLKKALNYSSGAKFSSISFWRFYKSFLVMRTSFLFHSSFFFAVWNIFRPVLH